MQLTEHGNDPRMRPRPTVSKRYKTLLKLIFSERLRKGSQNGRLSQRSNLPSAHAPAGAAALHGQLRAGREAAKAGKRQAITRPQKTILYSDASPRACILEYAISCLTEIDAPTDPAVTAAAGQLYPHKSTVLHQCAALTHRLEARRFKTICCSPLIFQIKPAKKM